MYIIANKITFMTNETINEYIIININFINTIWLSHIKSYVVKWQHFAKCKLLMKYNFKRRENIGIPIFSRLLFGGAYRNRTDDQSFADSCLTAWLRRHNIKMEQVTGIGPVTNPWQGFILPLNYTCILKIYL